MDIDIATVDSVYDAIDGRRTRAFLSVDGDEPPHAAVRAVREANVSVEGNEEGGV